MTLSLGYLTAKQKAIGDLKSSRLQEANIAIKLNITRQTVHQTLDIANLKIGGAIEEVTKINKIEAQTLNPDKGFLKGYSAHFKTQTFIAFSARTVSKSGISMRATAKNAANSKAAEKPCL